MIVMVGCDSSGLVHYLAGRYPGKIGWLISPSTGFKEPRAWLPYAIDNGRFTKVDQWSEERFFELLDRCKLSRYKPLWVTVPDEVGKPHATESLWYLYETRLRRYGWPLAYVLQDGCDMRRVPRKADVLFVGGTTHWKWRTTALFAAQFPRVHVGRVNVIGKIEYCERLGIESCDGTGFFRKGEGSLESQQLQDFLAGRRRHEEQLQLA